MLNEYQKKRIDERYTVLLDAEECPKCHSLRAAMFYEMSDGRPTVVAVCLKCGEERALKRYRLDEDEADKLAKWAAAVKAQDDQMCHICGRPAGVYALKAHHIIPKSHDPNKRYWYALSNGIALCEQCHELVHGEWMKKYRDRRY